MSPIIADTPLSPTQVLRFNYLFLNPIQVTVGKQRAEGTLREPYQFAHHDAEHTAHELSLQDYELLRAISPGYVVPRERLHSLLGSDQRLKFLRAREREFSNFFNGKLLSLSEARREPITQVLFQLFHQDDSISLYDEQARYLGTIKRLPADFHLLKRILTYQRNIDRNVYHLANHIYGNPSAGVTLSANQNETATALEWLRDNLPN